MTVMPTQVGYRNCAVLNCRKNGRTHPNLKFHLFPTNPQLRNEWLRNIQNPDIMNMNFKHLRCRFGVCEKHFTSAQYQTRQRLRLNRNGVPTLIDGTEEAEEPEVPFCDLEYPDYGLEDDDETDDFMMTKKADVTSSDAVDDCLDKNDKNISDSFNEVEIVGTPLSTYFHEESLHQKKIKLKEEFNEIIDSITTLEELHIVENEIAPIIPYLAAVRCVNTKND